MHVVQFANPFLKCDWSGVSKGVLNRGYRKFYLKLGNYPLEITNSP